GLEDVLDPHAHVARELEVVLDLEARVDDRRHPRLLVPDQVGGTPEVVVGDLPEEHRARAPRLSCTAARMEIVAPTLSQLRELEAESVHIMREVAAELERPVLLFSGGKDSIVLLRLA